jgi:hypothetical protein
VKKSLDVGVHPKVVRWPPNLLSVVRHFSTRLGDTHDGLRGFEICDPDGYVLFLGRPT